MRGLTALRRLELFNAPRSYTDADMDAVAGMRMLTRLALGGGAGAPGALLRRIAPGGGADGGAGGGGGGADGGGGGAAEGDEGGVELLELEVAFEWLPVANEGLVEDIARLTTLTALTVRCKGTNGVFRAGAVRKTTAGVSCVLSGVAEARQGIREGPAGGRALPAPLGGLGRWAADWPKAGRQALLAGRPPALGVGWGLLLG
jgi:hypothetical protein